MVAAAVTGGASTAESQTPKSAGAVHDEHSRRPPPLLKDNSNGIVPINHRKPKSRTVSSRYMSPSSSTSTSNSSSISSSISSSSSNSSRRFHSPLLSRNSTPLPNTASLGPKRSVSVDRRRPAAARPLIPELDSKHRNSTDVISATKLLVTSTRSLSVSFQGETFSLPVSKAKVSNSSPNLRKGTPERRRTATPLKGKLEGEDQVENSKPSDHHLPWPARNRVANANPMSRSLDCSVVGSVNGRLNNYQSMIDERRPSLDLGSSELRQAVVGRSPDDNSMNEAYLTASDSDSVSSGSTSGVHDSGGRNVARGIVASARFWQETNSRLRRLHDPGSPLSTSPGGKVIAPPKLKRYSSDGPLSSLRAMASPVRGGIRQASPSKVMTPVGSSPSRGHSPSRIRNAVSTISSNFVEMPSVLSFAVDVRRGKVGENRIVDAHLLRLLYNRHLQWRIVNARTEAVLLVQKHNAEKNLWNAWITISDLRDTVTKKRYRLRLLRAKLKLASILKGQMTFLEDWASFEKDQSVSLLGAVEALKASTLRLPVIGGATADVPSLKDAIGSAVDVMQAMASSIHSLLPQVEETNTLATELAKVTAKERVVLKQCTDQIASMTATQVRDSSLRTHIIQHNFLPST